MPSLNASVIGSPEYAKQLGKKSGETDITFYDLKKGETVVTMVEPSRYPEKIQSLYYSVAFGEHAVLVAEKLDQYFGESLLMINACGVKEGTIVLRNYITEDQLKALRKGTVLEGYTVMEDDPMKLRDRLIALAEAPRQPQTGPGTLTVDAAFNVRGIGTVALANIKSGTIKKHDQLKVLPGDKVAEVRSIQKHDEDFESAEAGDHVGVALKGVEAEDLDRGTVLTGADLKQTSTLTAKAEVIPYFQAQLHEGSTLHLGHWLQLSLARITKMNDVGDKKPEMTITLERPLVHPVGARAVLVYIDGGRLRVAGTIQLP
ncbi:TPA: elongation factor Tu [Candidatus Bathyarchaeota archaeon]|nr:elongation factor Tu [Candidatus Bathyarchaeota archaeon]